MIRFPSVFSALLLCATFVGAQAPAATAPAATAPDATAPAATAPDATAAAATATDGRTDLRVLFVGQDPAALKVMFSNMAVERTRKLYRERTPAWEALLRYHFKNVTVVYGDDYRVEMSDAADVTIFDVPPKALSEAKRGTDPVTGEPTYQAATYLPESFDRPAIMIAANAPRIGEPLGLKLDWL